MAKIRQAHPFDLELFNIRSPPVDVDAREAKKWRRLYQYDIVSWTPALFRFIADPSACVAS